MATVKVDTPIVRDAPEVRDARRWQYLAILMQEAHLDPKRIPTGQALFALMSPYERHGYTTADIESWVAACDPEIKPPWDEIACFRARAKDALRPRPSLGMAAVVAGGAAFAAAFLLTRARR